MLKRFLRNGLIALLLLAAVAVGAGQLGFWQGVAPVDLGVHGGRLKPPSATDNSVSSQAGLYPDHPRRQAAAIAPLALRGDGPATLARLLALVTAVPGARVVRHDGSYLYAQFSTRWMGFVDDAEFWFDPAAGVVQVRSASRLGQRDLGVNRQRIEAIRLALAAAP
jgi:uncharacterized protein (DUF1499 family)